MYNCELCGYSCTRKWNFIRHQKCHEKPELPIDNGSSKNFTETKCKYCDKDFSCVHSRQRHEESYCHLKPLEDGTYHCVKCDLKFTTKEELITHECKKVYTCENCKTTYASSFALARHAKTCELIDSMFVKHELYQFCMIPMDEFEETFRACNTYQELVQYYAKRLFKDCANRKVLITSSQNSKCYVLKKDNKWHVADRDVIVEKVTREISTMIIDGLESIKSGLNLRKGSYRFRKFENMKTSILDYVFQEGVSHPYHCERMFRQLCKIVTQVIVAYTQEHYGKRFNSLKIHICNENDDSRGST